MFHAKEGLCFEPKEGGDLRVYRMDDKGQVQFELILARSEIASIMAFASARGYCAQTFYDAYDFLRAPKDTICT